MITEKNLKVSAIIAAAGSGERAQMGKNKLLAPLYGAPALWHTLKKFQTPLIDEVIIAAAARDMEEISAIAAPFGFKVVKGGETRTESVKNALSEVTGDIVLVHDGARPFLSQELISKCIDSVLRFGSGVAALPVTDTVAAAHYGLITDYFTRSALYNLQTPQAFMTADLRRAYSFADGKNYTDDSSLYCSRIGFPHLVEGEKENRKLTFREDFLREIPRPDFIEGARTGIGVDVHAFGAGDGVTLAGVKIPCDGGLIAHSDGDVVFHAIIDALFSAAGLRDIGCRFPDTDQKYAGADSAKLLEAAVADVKKTGYAPSNISVTVQAERPRLAAYVPKMISNTAHILGIAETDVAIAAGTCEKLGFVGEGLGIAAYAAATLTAIK